nr:MAG TPA: hypothetical protein [Caudoviricetes sp.]
MSICVHSLLAYFLPTIVIYCKLQVLINKTSVCGNHKVHTVLKCCSTYCCIGKK